VDQLILRRSKAHSMPQRPRSTLSVYTFNRTAVSFCRRAVRKDVHVVSKANRRDLKVRLIVDVKEFRVVK
jgi:hypothetical protein